MRISPNQPAPRIIIEQNALQAYAYLAIADNIRGNKATTRVTIRFLKLTSIAYIDIDQAIMPN
ncbi:hypothetical protein SAMN05216516_106153 [Izhakiella capsodis]|uniref:Uncharacterized protein n=1 Tax=Izhakiella capsodis TaxID=1367852 RepID=A0A1I4YJQ7_9GAMM|nr:hypothetical protein [Izhakiella capsodis]SFN38252.1 hypothetical protein SAMN05216516_106153 [Izhakiella capsodis]